VSFPDQTQAHLRILATTDVHAHIHPHDYNADQPAGTPGLASAATLIATLRATSPNTLLFDNGDFLQGSPLADYMAEVQGLPPGKVHPAITAMNMLRYDAASLGNHEFNYGLDFLMRSISAAQFPFVCANAVVRHDSNAEADETLTAPFVVLERRISDDAGLRHMIRIGVIGLLPPQITIWDADHLRSRLTARDIVQTAAAFIPRIRAAGADLIIALCHSGIGPARPVPGMENAATALAALPGIDALILGHSHQVFPAPEFAAMAEADVEQGLLSGKPAVMAGSFGSHLGVIDLVLHRNAAGWQVRQAQAQAVPVPQGDSDASRAICAETRDDHLATLRHMRRRIGKSAVPLTSYFAMLPGNAALRVVAQAQRQHVARALGSTEYAGLPILSAVSPFRMGGRGGPGFYTDVPAGDLTLRHIADLYAFPNRIRAMCVTGADLTQWLERSAALFNRLAPGLPDQPLLNPAMPATEFDVIDGVTWAVDLALPARYSPEGLLTDAAANRVSDLRYQGRSVAATDRFIVATNSYRASSNTAFPGASEQNVVLAGDISNRDVLHQYVAARDVVAPEPGQSWRFMPQPGTGALFDTGARAMDHLASLTGLAVEPVGPGSSGFSRFRLVL
jgi:2',3'-cyclic-nucleotide 2'-phosphodiesterase/3'-nucleotidase